jgi:hypothetical protein
VEDSDSLPGAERNVIDPTSILAADLALRPIVYADCAFKISAIAGGMRSAEKWVHSVAASSVDESASRAEQATAKSIALTFFDLVLQKSIAPGLQQAGKQ